MTEQEESDRDGNAGSAEEGAVGGVTTEEHWLVVRWRDLYLRVMKPSKGPGRAGIAPNRRGPSFFCLRRPKTTQVLAAAHHLPGADNVYRISSGHPRPLTGRPIEGAAPSSGGNITPGNNTATARQTIPTHWI